MSEPTITNRGHIRTEQANPASRLLDVMPVHEAVLLMNQQDQIAVAAVGAQSTVIAEAVQLVTAAFLTGGRLIYVGAGTSGRLGVLDAAECPPTFSTDPGMVVGVIAGGPAALTRSIENVEDDATAGAAAMENVTLGANDVVFGIAAGGTTPFVYGALDEARRRQAKTIFLVCTAREHVTATVDLIIALETGPEVLTGSTRLKAGTATKLVLNTVTTLAMVQLGKVMGNTMVDLDATKNSKLVDRGARIIEEFTGRNRDESLALLFQAHGKVKRAIVMHHRRCDRATADRLLADAGGRLRSVLEEP
ncbi:MAG: N-acetylmuramic acid 6-phosphate etherase [Phycisphaerae bacterium]|nr:N-acetylmuramic acid 6-phosphate etherase [Phycisphaerae bacterium]